MKVFWLYYLLPLMALSACSTVKGGKLSYGKLPENILLVPSDTSAKVLKKQETVVLKATDAYRAGPLKRLIQGKNYRMAWDAPVEVPVLWMDTFQGGLKIIETGGGGQTYSLDLKDGKGRMMTLRSVNKDPSSLVPKFMKALGLGNVIFDAISAGHPYGAIPAAELAEAAGIIHTRPRLYYVPRQPTLDTLNEKYGNHLYLLEYEPEGGNPRWVKNVSPPIALMETEDLQLKLWESSLHRTEQKELLRARLLDLVIGDWDRHPGNWGWVSFQDGKTTKYFPVAADRDNVFYKIGGIVPSLINRPVFMAKIRPFRKKIHYLKGYMVNSEKFDPEFLNRMTLKDFSEAAFDLQKLLTDEVVEKALHSWPDTLYSLNGEEIMEKIKARRDRLPEYAAKFYKILARCPQVFGTHQPDRFVVKSAEGGNISVQVFSQGPSSEVLHYERLFSPKETKRIYLMGLKGVDVFEVEKRAEKKIKTVIIEEEINPFQLKTGGRS